MMITLVPLTRTPASMLSDRMVIALVMVTPPNPPGSRTLISPPAAVFEIAPANVLHGAVRLHGYEIATLRTQLNLPRVLSADQFHLAPDAEPAQPLYARYWLHNRGPAPLGGLPAVAYSK